MLNLIIKDILVQKKSILFALFYCFILVFAFQSLEQAGPIAATVAVVYILIINSFAYEEKNKSEVMLNSLPISRRDIVLAKYLSIFVYMGLSILTYMCATLIIKALIPMKITTLSWKGISAAFLSVGLMTSVYLPITFKFGYIKAKLFNLVVFLLFFFSPTILINIYNNPKYHQSINNFFKTLLSWSDWQIAALPAGLSLLLLFISYSISLHIYKNREF
jgi:ABC-type transport system involved in multi-copper enzyme maturation permease subunit